MVFWFQNFALCPQKRTQKSIRQKINQRVRVAPLIYYFTVYLSATTCFYRLNICAGENFEF